MLVRALLAFKVLGLDHTPPQSTSTLSPLPPWEDLTSKIILDIPGYPSKSTANCPAIIPFLEIDRSMYHHHIKIFTDGSRSDASPATAAAIYIPALSICKTWRLPSVTDVLTAELYAIQQALYFLPVTHPDKRKVVVYTDSLSSLHLLLSHHPTSSTFLVHAIQRALLRLSSEGWEITLQWVPAHSGIHGNEVVDAAAKMALKQSIITQLPQPLSTYKRLIQKACRSTWNSTLRDTLRATNMSKYRTDSSPKPWVRRQSRIQDVALTRLRIGRTTLNAHLHRLNLVPDPYCPWCKNVPETIEHLMLQCPRFYSHRVQLRSQLQSQGVYTFDLPTLLGAAEVPPSKQQIVIRLTCIFLRRTGQLNRL